MALAVDIVTIFPGMFSGILGESIVSRALRANLLTVEFTNIRDFATDRHRSVDDRPYGGGPGMVFKPEPVFAAVESVLARARAPAESTRMIALTPQGRKLDQAYLRDLSRAEWVILLCGHYEGFDERILEGLRFEQVSIGDYVLSGGEIPAMVILDGVVRLIPGALGHPGSADEESFEIGLIEHPQYTRPPEFRGMQVPEVLVSGNHKLIEKWKREQSLKRTLERRRDLLEPAEVAGGGALETSRSRATGAGSSQAEGRGADPKKSEERTGIKEEKGS